jgi:hypothetical protein
MPGSFGMVFLEGDGGMAAYRLEMYGQIAALKRVDESQRGTGLVGGSKRNSRVDFLVGYGLYR